IAVAMPNGKGLCRRAKVDRLWRVWYALLILAVHGFLLHASFQRYSAFRSRALREQWPMGPMNFHLAGAIAAALMLPLFLYSAFLKTDNFAEDGVQVGRDRDSLRVAAVDVAEGVVGCGACLSRLLRHFVPYTSALHLLMSLCLLLPMPVLEAEEIHREQLAKATHPVSTEVFNLLLALAILTVRYPSVFWFSNRVFSLLFSVVVCASGLHTFLAYEATSVLYKAATVGSTESVVLKIPPAATLALDSVGSMLLLLASGAFFEFGYAQVLNNLRKYRHYLQLEASSSGSSERSNGSSGAGVGSIDGAACCASNANLIFGLLLMLAAALCKAP
uniref:TRC8_N domain-containing protein n=1 Tax=Macrostomum lignano TaxID=282301 RepID=A0A1I8IH98_9PLAT